MERDPIVVAVKRFCRECSTPFSIPVDEQLWYRFRGLNLPGRCKACRDAEKRAAKRTGPHLRTVR